MSCVSPLHSPSPARRGARSRASDTTAEAPVTEATFAHTGEWAIRGTSRSRLLLKILATKGHCVDGNVTLEYQWKVNGASVGGATGKTWKVDGSAKGRRITVTVTGSGAGYTTTSRTSSPTAAVR